MVLCLTSGKNRIAEQASGLWIDSGTKNVQYKEIASIIKKKALLIRE